MTVLSNYTESICVGRIPFHEKGSDLSCKKCRTVVGSSQLFRDKTDDWDLKDEHRRGFHEESPIPEYCKYCHNELFNGPFIKTDLVAKELGSTNFMQVVCKECGESVGTGAWSYCLNHRCMWSESGRLGDQSVEHLIGSYKTCENCKRYNLINLKKDTTNYNSFHNPKDCKDKECTIPHIWVGKLPETKLSNPKDIIGSDKVPMGLVPPVTTAYLALGHLEGDLKYGRANWREAGVRTMIYVDAAKRHIDKFRDGEWADPQTKVPHLANALACLSIIVDAYHAGKLNDDRPKSVDSAKVIDELGAVVKHLKTLHSDMRPIDYFIDGPKQRE